MHVVQTVHVFVVKLVKFSSFLSLPDSSLVNKDFQCRAVALLRRQNPLKLAQVPELANRSQPLVGRGSPYCGGHVEDISLLNNFFRSSIRALVAKI